MNPSNTKPGSDEGIDWKLDALFAEMDMMPDNFLVDWARYFGFV